MRSFREFLIERYGLNQNYGLPNLDDLRDPSLAPIGGYDSFSQRANDAIEKQRKSGPLQQLYNTKSTLEKFANLAEQAYSAIASREEGVADPKMQAAYRSANIVNNNKWMLSISEGEIIGGQYPQIRINDLEWGTTQGIFTSYNNNGIKYYYFDVGKLRNLMEEIKKQLMVHERGNERTRYRAGIADDAWKTSSNLVRGIMYGQSNLKIPGVTGL